ncbi:MAG: Fe-S-binding domain-containing protein [Phycisphaerae bacterium]|nr:Fe-S-binding domain-containing protein [Phycisphaerae bacterium]MBM90896.1 Fe-S-binding domain-containing protein [Phycisphaerae bacterium]
MSLEVWSLLALIFFPALVGILIGFVKNEDSAYRVALATTLALCVPALALLVNFDFEAAGTTQFAHSISWVSGLGLEFSIGMDSVSMLLILLSVLLGPIVVLASKTAITKDRRMYYAWLTVLQGAMVGVFAAQDLLLFYICFEFTLLPMFILIRKYGSTNRIAASTKFFLYTFTGSMLTLAGLVYVVWFVAQPEQYGSWTLDISLLTAYAGQMSAVEQGWVLLAMLAGFAVKVPLFPFHTWLPLAHTEAPTAGSVILAGVLLKLGTYGFYRFAIPLAPQAFFEYAPAIAVLAIIGIIYAGLICWVQTDIKKLVAYSSVSHLGFCILGLAALNVTGLSGSILYMLSHGFSTGGLFLMIGFMYERYHTRDMDTVGGLASKMPVWATFMVFFAMASVGLPGLNGFPSELLCLISAFQSDAAWSAAGEPGAWGSSLGPWFAVFAGTGMVIAAMYLLFMVGKICFGPLREPADHHPHDELPTDLNTREIMTLTPLAIGCVLFGLQPTMLLDAVNEPVNNTVRLVEAANGFESSEPVMRPVIHQDHADDHGGTAHD